MDQERQVRFATLSGFKLGLMAGARRGFRAGKWVGGKLVVALLGFVCGVVALYLLQSRDAPPLEPWHRVKLTTEFRAENQDQVKTFEDYLRLEEELFKELDGKVYQRTATGPAYTLARFSADSAADPRGRQPDWNRSFELPGDGPGILLLHGMSDSPYSLRALAESFHRQGYWVLGVRMPGHGTAPAALKSLVWEDLAAVTRLGMEHLASRVGSQPIHMVGYSTGALLAMDYVLNPSRFDPTDRASSPEPASLILISPAIGIGNIAALAGWIKALSRLPGLERLGWESIRPEFDPHKYNSFATNAGHQVHRLVDSVTDRVDALAAAGPLDPFPPTLVFLSAVDATVSPDAVIDNFMVKLSPGPHELFLFDINRSSVRSTVLVSDPGPLTARLLGDSELPFHFSLITNQSAESSQVALRRKAPRSNSITTEPLDLQWPPGLISLSHIALQFPPDDPLYGQRPSRSNAALHLGQMAIQGERGLLMFPSNWLLRVRHNPFYELLEERVMEWVSDFGDGEGLPERQEETFPKYEDGQVEEGQLEDGQVESTREDG
ncbi:MAG: alpha/beta fold hydrolase [Deltaproteobacteria bacterium]|nr:alpha/beta fold hydrolase [Deltaproteobacteria bacterium]